MSLVMFMAKSMIKRAMRNMSDMPRPSDSAYKGTGRAFTNNDNVIDTLWVGMTTDQLIKSFGTPESKTITSSAEEWTFLNINGPDTTTIVTIRNNAVSGWVNKVTPTELLTG